MVVLIVGMLICIALAGAVVGLVAVPARRQGREVLTPKGEEVVGAVRDKTGNAVNRTSTAVSSAKDKTSDAISTARTKVNDSRTRKAS